MNHDNLQPVYSQISCYKNNMWKKLKKSSDYFLTFIEKNAYKIFLTDYVTIWYLYFTRANFLKCLKESNSRLNMNDNKLIEYGTLLLEYPDCINNFTRECKDGTLDILMSGSNKICIKPFKLQLKLVEGSKEMFFHKVTQQLIKTIHDLNSSQYELCMLLKKKDEVIKEYKCQGGKIALKHLRDDYFNEEAHMNEHTIYKDNFDKGIPDSLLTKNVDVPDEYNLLNEEKIKIENLDIKIESASTNTNGEPTIPAITVEPPSTPIVDTRTEFTFPTISSVKSGSTMQRNQEETSENRTIKRESPFQELNDQSNNLPTVKQENSANTTRAMVIPNIKRENMTSPRKKLRKFCF